MTALGDSHDGQSMCRTFPFGLGRGEGTLMRVAIVTDGPSVNRAVLTLVSVTLQMSGRNRNCSPAFGRPSGVLHDGGVFRAGDFAANGPIETREGWRMGQHGRLLSASMRSAPLLVNACGSGKWGNPTPATPAVQARLILKSS